MNAIPRAKRVYKTRESKYVPEDHKANKKAKRSKTITKTANSTPAKRESTVTKRNYSTPVNEDATNTNSTQTTILGSY